MTKGHKATLIISGIIVTGAIAWIIYNRKKKGAEVEVILAKVGASQTQNMGDVGIAENLFSKDLTDVAKNPLPAGAKTLSVAQLTDIAKNLKKSIEGAGTTQPLFNDNFRKLKSVFEYQVMAKIYKTLTGRKLWDDMMEEQALRKGTLGILTANEGDSIFFIDEIGNQLKTMPKYRFS